MVTVAALYHFTRFEDPAALRGPLRQLCAGHGLRGTLILAGEGINGTVAGPADGIAALVAHLRALPGCAGLEWKESHAATMPFGRMKVRLKPEIVTMGVPGIDPRREVGTYVQPGDWNALLAMPDVALIDTRNAFEVALGTFRGAIDPGITSFRAFPDWWRRHADDFRGKRVAMFCTGGIRCEKASGFLLANGATGVLHLRGGILKYLEEIPPADSLWQGQCFVFDERGGIGHDHFGGDRP